MEEDSQGSPISIIIHVEVVDKQGVDVAFRVHGGNVGGSCVLELPHGNLHQTRVGLSLLVALAIRVVPLAVLQYKSENFR